MCCTSIRCEGRGTGSAKAPEFNEESVPLHFECLPPQHLAPVLKSSPSSLGGGSAAIWWYRAMPSKARDSQKAAMVLCPSPPVGSFELIGSHRGHRPQPGIGGLSHFSPCRLRERENGMSYPPGHHRVTHSASFRRPDAPVRNACQRLPDSLSDGSTHFSEQVEVGAHGRD